MEKTLNAQRPTPNARGNASELGVETRSLPPLAGSYPRRFTFYVARPTRSIGRWALGVGRSRISP
jgi:hypothetical protein